jgi:hypothetical protein
MFKKKNCQRNILRCRRQAPPTRGARNTWLVSYGRAINHHSQIAGTGCLAGLCYAVRLDPAK